MGIGAPKELSTLRGFFLQPRLPKHRQYETLRAYLVEGRPAKEGARAFGYSLGSFYFSAITSAVSPSRLFYSPRLRALRLNRTIRSTKSAIS